MQIHELARLRQLSNVEASDLAAVSACLQDSNPAVRELAATILGGFGAAGIPGLVAALDDNQPTSIRVAAASALARIGSNGDSAVSVLCQCLEGPDDLLRWHAAFALSRIGGAALAPLRGLLGSSDPRTQAAAADALGWMGGDARDAADALEAMTSSPSPSAQLASHSALLRLGGDPSDHLPQLVAALDHQDVGVRRLALQRLGELREMGSQTNARLLRCLDDPAIRAEAALALARNDAKGPAVVQALTHLIRDPQAEVRANAGIALAHLGPEAESSLSDLQTMQNDDDPRVAAIAAAAVERILDIKK